MSSVFLQQLYGNVMITSEHNQRTKRTDKPNHNHYHVRGNQNKLI